jgi:glycosyltransferase involved in cell wall biosynthesis
LSDQSGLDGLRVGVPIPNCDPTAGGGYEFQQMIFNEIIRRINSGEEMDSHKVTFVPIATDPESAAKWSLDRRKVIDVFPNRSLRIRSGLHRRLTRLRHLGRPLLDWQTLVGKNVVKQLAKHVDVIWSLQPGLVANQLPFILTIWDLQHRLQPFFPEVSRSGEWEGRQHSYATNARKAFLNVVGTRCGADELQRFYGIDPARVLINAFPCPPAVAIKEEEGLALMSRLSLTSQQFLLYPAQFWAHKNHLAALLALRQLVDQGHNLKLALTGSDKGTFCAIDHLIDQLGLRSWVVNAGFVERRDLAALYSNCFALIYPSFFGPDNIPPLEAMSYRVPALVADVPGALEQYGQAVLRFDPGCPDQIVACVNRLSSEPSLRDGLIQQGLALISRLTPASYVDRLVTFLSDNSISLRCAGLAS